MIVLLWFRRDSDSRVDGFCWDWDQCLKSRPGLWAGPGRLGLKIPPGRADLVQKFLRAGPTWAENSSGPGRPGPKILPGRADLGRKFLRAGPGRLGLKIRPEISNTGRDHSPFKPIQES